MVLLICGNKKSDKMKESVQAAVDRLTSQGFTCIGDDTPLYSGIRGLSLYPREECDRLCDGIVSVGGDGTMLRHAHRAIRIDKTIFGINAGGLGYLCAFEIGKLEKITAESVAKLQISRRSLLEVVFSTEEGEKLMQAVNDTVVGKGTLERAIGLSVDTKERRIGSYKCDGIIVSTPTGSTAYNLSAGGPICDPSLDLMVLTPVCAHSMFRECFVFGGDTELRIRASDSSGQDIYVMVDSYGPYKLQAGTEVRVRRSGSALKLLLSDERDFYGILRHKMGENN